MRIVYTSRKSDFFIFLCEFLYIRIHIESLYIIYEIFQSFRIVEVKEWTEEASIELFNNVDDVVGYRIN